MNATVLPAYLLGLVWLGAALDLRARRVPNWLTLGGAVAGVTLQIASAGTGGLATATAGFAVGLLVLLPGFLLRWTGPADVKLLAAAGTVLGPYATLIAGLASILVGLAIAACIASVSLVLHAARSPWQRYGVMLRTLAVTGRPIYIPPATDEVMATRFPYAVSIALGATIVAAWSGRIAGIGVQP